MSGASASEVVQDEQWDVDHLVKRLASCELDATIADSSLVTELCEYFGHVKETPPKQSIEDHSHPVQPVDLGHSMADKDMHHQVLTVSQMLQEAAEQRLKLLEEEKAQRVACFVQEQNSLLELQRSCILQHRTAMLARILSQRHEETTTASTTSEQSAARSRLSMQPAVAPTASGGNVAVDDDDSDQDESEDREAAEDSDQDGLWPLEEDEVEVLRHTGPTTGNRSRFRAPESDPSPVVTGRGRNRRARDSGTADGQDPEDTTHLLSQSVPISIPKQSGQLDSVDLSDDDDAVQMQQPPHTLVETSYFLDSIGTFPSRPGHTRRFSVL